MGARRDLAENARGAGELLGVAKKVVRKASVVGADFARLHGPALERYISEIALGIDLESERVLHHLPGARCAGLGRARIERRIERVLPFDQPQAVPGLTVRVAFAEQQCVTLASQAAAAGKAEGNVLQREFVGMMRLRQR